MLVMDRPKGRVEVASPLTLDAYLALPVDTRAEIVDGVLRPMTRTNKLHREVQSNLRQFLKAQKPRELRVTEEEVVVFKLVPPTARIPDVVVFRSGNDPEGKTNFTLAGDVLLCIEVVSRSTQTADRFEKPGEYARNGIPAFWRVELEPEITIYTYQLSDGVYADNDRFGIGSTAFDRTLEWVKVPVVELLGDYTR
jgi:Uma2 family endonuclease